MNLRDSLPNITWGLPSTLVAPFSMKFFTRSGQWPPLMTIKYTLTLKLKQS